MTINKCGVKLKMDKETDPNHSLRGIITEKVDNNIDEALSKLIVESGISDVHEIVKKLDLQHIRDGFGGSSRRSTPVQPWVIDSNHHDYAAIIDGLNTNSAAVKIKTLDKLFSQIVDTKQNYWTELSQSLRKCIVSTNNEIFMRTLKIHHRIISIPNLSCDGYLSLLKGTFLLLNSRYFTDLNKNRILQSLQLIIVAQNIVIKYLLHASHNVIDEIITAFINIVTFKSVFEYIGAIDPKCKWLRNFCYGTYIRNFFFASLGGKKCDFVKQVINTFVKKLNDNDSESGLPYAYFLSHLWSYENNLKYFPPEATIESLIIKFNQRKKLELQDLLINLFSHNPHLITSKLLDLLVEPLSTVNRSNIKNVIETHQYIFPIIDKAAQSRNFRLLFGPCGKPRKGMNRQIPRNCINFAQRITDLTILAVKINQYEDKTDPNIILPLLSCCTSIYESHPVALTHVNSTKFIENLHEYYRMSWKNDVTVRGALLVLLRFFYTNHSPMFKLFSCDNEILVDLFSFTPIDELKTIVNRLGSDKVGFEFLKNHHNKIIKPYLEEIWFLGDLDCDYTRLILFLFVIKLNTKSIVALLSDDNDDTTVVEGGNQSINLAELIEKSLNKCGEPAEEYLGLLVMKVLITNLDLLLYLQVNHQMQEKLKSLQEEENFIIDAHSSLTRNILISLEFVGTFDSKINGKFLEMTELQQFPQFELIQTGSKENEFRSFLESGTSSSDFPWLVQARRAFKNSLDIFDVGTLTILLKQLPKTYVNRKIDLQWPPSDCVYYQLLPEDFSGISLMISYGLKTGLLKTYEDDTHNENLILLIKQSRAFLSHQPDFFSHFDWFVGAIYLICAGDYDQCKSVLIDFTNTQVTSLVWATFGQEFDDVLQVNFYQHLSVILEENCSCYQALKMLGIDPEMLVQSWLNQCFFNFLKFEEICNFLAFSVLYPVECLLYYVVGLFQHLNESICTVTHSPRVESILNMTEMSNFRLTNHMNLIEQLTKRYRNLHKL